jgi:hypothetical protein
MIKRKILAPIYLHLLTLSYAVITFAASCSKKKGKLYRLKFFLGAAIISLGTTLTGCQPKPKPTCYEKPAIKDTIKETCYKAVPDTTSEKKKSDTLKNKKQNQNSNTSKQNSTNNQNNNQQLPSCYAPVKK